MTVTATNSWDGPFAPNGSTTTFPFTFDALTAGEVKVVRRSTLGVDTVLGGYSVTLTGSGGSVIFTSAPAAGDPIYIISDPDYTQEANFANQGNWSPTAINAALDRAAAKSISLKNDVDRTFKVPFGETPGALLPSAADRADKVVAFDLNGDIYAPDVSAQNLVTLAGISGEIVTVAARDADIGTVAGNLTGSNSIGTVAGSITNVNLTGGSIANVNAVAADLTNINAVAANATNINAVAGSITNVNAVGASLVNVNAVAADLANVNAVQADLTNINTAAGGLTNINTVASNIGSVNTTATNIAAIIDAPNQATAAVNAVASLASISQTLGRSVDPVAGTANSANTFVNGTPVAASGTLSQIRVYGFSGGTLKVRRFTLSGSTFTQTGTDTNVVVASSASGKQTIPVNIAVNAGEYIGFYAPASAIAITNSVTQDPGGYYKAATPGDVTTLDTSSTVASTTRIEIGFDIKTQYVTIARVQAVETSAAASGAALTRQSASQVVAGRPSTSPPVAGSGNGNGTYGIASPTPATTA